MDLFEPWDFPLFKIVLKLTKKEKIMKTMCQKKLSGPLNTRIFDIPEFQIPV